MTNQTGMQWEIKSCRGRPRVIFMKIECVLSKGGVRDRRACMKDEIKLQEAQELPLQGS